MKYSQSSAKKAVWLPTLIFLYLFTCLFSYKIEEGSSQTTSKLCNFPHHILGLFPIALSAGACLICDRIMNQLS